MGKYEELSIREVDDVLKQLTEYDERSLVIVGSAFVENGISNLLLKNLKECSSTKRIIEWTFGNKIDIANALNIISEREYHDLIRIKKIRNMFAHVMKVKSLDVKESEDIIKGFTLFNAKIKDLELRDVLTMQVILLGIGLAFRVIVKDNGIIEDVFHGYESYDNFKEMFFDLTGNIGKRIVS